MRRSCVLALAAAGVGLGMASLMSERPVLIWNHTPSAPLGLYWVASAQGSVGDRVAVRPVPNLAADLDRRGVLKRGRYLIKRIAAGEGDEVCRRGTIVSVNGAVVAEAKERDARGNPLPAWEGCDIVASGKAFLLGETGGSYDGRYFGVLPIASVVGVARLLR